MLDPPSAPPAAPTEPQGRAAASHLLVQAGEYVCALPLASVRQVLRSLPLHPLPGSAPELRGLAEFAGDPLPVLDLARLARAPQGANPAFPVTVVAWAGPHGARELVGLAADAALDVAALPIAEIVPAAPGAPGSAGDGGLVAGDVWMAGRMVRVIDLQALGEGIVSDAFLVLRRGGATWAVARPAIEGLARRGETFEVRVAAGALTADEVVGVTAELRLHPVGGVLRRYWPEAAHGLAVHDALPVVLIDPLAPPRSLLAAPVDRPAIGAAGGAAKGELEDGN